MATCRCSTVLTTLIFCISIFLEFVLCELEESLGNNHEFKIEVAARSQECFYQYAAKDANIYISYEVIRGGNRNINFFLYDTKGQYVAHQYDTPEGTAEAVALETGNYKFCFDNEAHGFGSKLVYVNLLTIVFEDWSKFYDNLDEVHNLAVNFTEILSDVQLSLHQVVQYQTRTRLNVMRDWYLITGNESYVGYWSIAQSVLVVMAAVGQVCFLRRMFRTTTLTPTAKPRA